MSAGTKFNSDTYWSATYDVIAYNDNAESDECTYEVVASFARFDDARAFAEDRDSQTTYIGIRPPHAEITRALAWLGAMARA